MSDRLYFTRTVNADHFTAGRNSLELFDQPGKYRRSTYQESASAKADIFLKASHHNLTQQAWRRLY